MKDRAILSLVIVVAASPFGCSQRKEAAVTEAFREKVVTREPRLESRPKEEGHPMEVEQPRHGDHDHHHAFTDPAERARTWNDPERDEWQHPEEIVAALALRPGATVADIGAGTGYMTQHLSKAVGKEGIVIAIDAEPAMIAYLANRRDHMGPSRIELRKVGMDDPGLPDVGVDAVLTLDTWHHIKGPEAYAAKVYAGLKRKGRFVVVDCEVDAESGPPKAMRLEPGQVTKPLEAAGFRVEVVRESMPHHYMVVGHKD